MLNTSDIIRGYIDTVILARLSGKDSYGYEINKEISLMSAGNFEIKEATLYTSFRRMEKEEWIISYWGDEEKGARRRYYSITEKGRKILKENIGHWQEIKGVLEKLLEV